MKLFYLCGCCASYHPRGWDGDCRDDNNRLAPDELDGIYGRDGWREVKPPEQFRSLTAAELGV